MRKYKSKALKTFQNNFSAFDPIWPSGQPNIKSFPLNWNSLLFSYFLIGEHCEHYCANYLPSIMYSGAHMARRFITPACLSHADYLGKQNIHCQKVFVKSCNLNKIISSRTNSVKNVRHIFGEN